MSSFKFANRNNNKNVNINKKRIVGKSTLTSTFQDIASGITSVFVFIILAVFPLYTHDMYFDILSARYYFFLFWGIILTSLLVVLGILYLILDAKNGISDVPAYKRFFFSFHPKNIMKHITITDIFAISMLIVCIISTCLSEFKEESFYGTAGRRQGLGCWIVYILTYFAITRTYKFSKWHLTFAVLACCFSSIWGVLDFFWLDPFGFFVNVNEQQHSMFASSIGNLDTFTNYTTLGFGLSGVLFMRAKGLPKTIFYAITTIICCAGCVYGLADNVVLGLFAFYLIIPFFTFKDRRDFVRYLFLIDFLFITLFFFYISMKAPRWNWGQGSFFRDVLAHKEIAFLFIPLTIIIAIITFLLNKAKSNYGDMINNNLKPLDSLLPKWVKPLYTGIVVLGFTFITYVILDMNVFKQHVDIWSQLPSSHQLVFDDYWGTHRGHNWRIAFTNFFQNFDLLKKLFGYGPDTYLIVSERTFYKEMVERFGEVYDSAHNEYINYLICEGILGLISYLGMFISGIVIAIKYIKKNPLILAPVVAVICYMAQAFVNIAIPITTPVFFTLMYIGVAYHFQYKRENPSEIPSNVTSK